MSIQIECLRCGEPLKQEMKKCPKCGSRDRRLTASATDSIKILDVTSRKERGEGYYKFRKYPKSGEKMSWAGKLARENADFRQRSKHVVSWGYCTQLS